MEESNEDRVLYSRDGSIYGPDKVETISKVQEFTYQYGLDDIQNHLQNGALLLDDPDISRLDGLTAEEVAALGEEMLPVSTSSTTFFANWWSYPAVCSIGGIAYGVVEDMLWHQLRERPMTGGGWTSMMGQYGPCVTSAVAGCWLTVLINLLVGRRWTAILAAVLKCAMAVGMALSPDLQTLIICEILAAIGSGILTCTLPIYLAELSPARTRGTMISAWQFNVYTGTALAVVLRFFTQEARLGIASNITAVALLGCLWISPESPYRSVRTGKMREAYHTLRRYRETDIQAARDLYKLYNKEFHRPPSSKVRTTIRGFTGLLTAGTLRRAKLASIVMMLARTIPDIVVRLTWTQWVYLAASGTGVPLFIGIVVVGIGLFYCRAVSVTMVDSIGRRKLELACMLSMFVVLLIAIPTGYIMSPSTFGLVTRLVFLFPYVLGETVPLVYAAELFPSVSRETGMATAVSVFYAKDMIVQYVLGSFMEIQNPYGHLVVHSFVKSAFFFSLLQALCLILVFLLTQETTGRSLGEMGSLFDVSTRRLVLYRVRMQIPYIFQRYFLLREIDLEPLKETKYGVGSVILGHPPATDAEG